MVQKTDKTIFLLDAFALIYRSYYAFIKNPRVNSKGLNTSAAFGFLNTLLEVIETHQPSHLAVVFDPLEGGTSRHDDFADYKANRESMPEDIKNNLPYIMRMVKGFNIPLLMADGYEADDVIGTLAKKAAKEGYIVYMMTPDKDYAQLVEENIFMYKPPRMGNKAEILGIEEVKEKFGVERPEQVIDILGMWGDAVDNIPGIPGVGEKKAKEFVQLYGSMEGLYENLHEIKGKLKEKIENARDQAFMSKQLATILIDAPVEFNEEDLLISEPNKEELIELFTELEFRTSAKRIFGEEITASSTATAVNQNQMDLFGGPNNAFEQEAVVTEFSTIQTTEHKYTLIQTLEDAQKLATTLSTFNSVCFDTETTSLNTYEAEVVGLSFAAKPGEAFYVALPENFDEAKQMAQVFKPLLENGSTQKIGQNIKFDLLVLLKYGITVSGPFFDTMVAHYLLEPETNRRGMDYLAETYLNYKPVSITELIGEKGKNQKSMRSVAVETVSDYACEDADITLQLKEKFEPLLKENGVFDLFTKVECPLIGVLAAMENEGINLDTASLKEFSKELNEELIAIEAQIFELAGTEFKISSPKQVGEILFDRLKIVDKAAKTKTGQYSTSEETLSKIENSHPIVSKILDFREVTKLKNTYVDTLPNMVNKSTHHIHTTYNQVVAATGRLSSDHPNLQNIPIRTEKGRMIRKAFIPRSNEFKLLAADYSQVELRIMAALSQDAGMIEAFSNKIDIHTATAAKVYNVSLDEVDRTMRSKAKMVNFGIIYGISAFGLSQRLNIPRGEAKEIIENYFAQYPGVKTYMDQAVEDARSKGYVETILGRRRYLADINSRNATVRGFAERNAINAPIQGSAADIIKVAMINIQKELKQGEFQSKMLLQVHDELVFDAHASEIEKLSKTVSELMESAVELAVPLEVEIGIGENWLQAH